MPLDKEKENVLIPSIAKKRMTEIFSFLHERPGKKKNMYFTALV